MNLSVYLPDSLSEEFEAFARKEGITKNAAIRKAIELLIKSEGRSKWGTWIDQLQSDETFDGFESYRSELADVSKDIF